MCYAEGAYLHAEQYTKRAGTKDITKFVGIDVPRETIAVSVADQQSGLKPVRSFGQVALALLVEQRSRDAELEADGADIA